MRSLSKSKGLECLTFIAFTKLQGPSRLHGRKPYKQIIHEKRCACEWHCPRPIPTVSDKLVVCLFSNCIELQTCLIVHIKRHSRLPYGHALRSYSWSIRFHAVQALPICVRAKIYIHSLDEEAHQREIHAVWGPPQLELHIDHGRQIDHSADPRLCFSGFSHCRNNLDQNFTNGWSIGWGLVNSEEFATDSIRKNLCD